MSRDSSAFIIGILMGVLGYLATAGNPMTWTYAQWIQAVSTVLAIVSAKLGSSPLKGTRKTSTTHVDRTLSPKDS